MASTLEDLLGDAVQRPSGESGPDAAWLLPFVVPDIVRLFPEPPAPAYPAPRNTAAIVQLEVVHEDGYKRLSACDASTCQFRRCSAPASAEPLRPAAPDPCAEVSVKGHTTKADRCPGWRSCRQGSASLARWRSRRVRLVLALRSRSGTGEAASAGDVSYPPPRLRAAVVQIEPIHENVIPPLVHALRSNGVEPTVYLNDLVRARRPGFRKRHPEISEFLRFVPLTGQAAWQALAERVLRLSPDLMVMNTFQFNAPSNWAHFWPGPMLGLVHNALRLLDAPDSMALVREGRTGLMTMAPHVTAYLMARDPMQFAATTTLTTVPPRPPLVRRVRRPEPGRRRIVVPGMVSFDVRDYEGLVDALPAVVDEAPPGTMEIVIVGNGDDRPKLEQMVRDRGLDGIVRFARLNEHGFVPSELFNSLLQGATFILPALPLMSDEFGNYRTIRITTSIQDSVSLMIPPILDRWSSTVYDVPSVPYLADHVADGLVRAATMSDEEIDSLRTRLAARRQHELERACAETGMALRTLGL